MELEERIRQRTHALWESAGSPEGREKEFRAKAMRELGVERAARARTEASVVVGEADRRTG